MIVPMTTTLEHDKWNRPSVIRTNQMGTIIIQNLVISLFDISPPMLLAQVFLRTFFFYFQCQKIDSVTELLSQSESAIRCFKAAFRLSDSELNVWIELGSFAYVIHSFCKRFLNSSEGTKLNMESFEKVQRNIGSMLIESKMAFEMSKKVCFSSSFLRFLSF